MNKEAYYFSHDSNARNDYKISELRAEYGWEGYGLYWGIIETLSESSNYTYPKKLLAGLAISLNYPLDKLKSFLKRCFELNLLVEKDEIFYSESLMKRMEKVDEKRQRRVEAGRAGGMAKAKAEQSLSVATENTSNAISNCKYPILRTD